MPDIPFHLARAQGHGYRRLYRAALPLLSRSKVDAAGSIALDVFSYSNETMLPEQVASIRSFIRHAGRPRRFVVVSDGSHSSRSLQILRNIDPCVGLSTSAEWVPANVPAGIRRYLSEHPTGRQLALIMCLPLDAPTLYVDADVLFFRGAGELRDLAQSKNVPAMYLQDCEFSGDARLLHSADEQANPVNTGVLLLFEKLDWSLSIERFLELDGEPISFTNQTMTHLTMHANGAIPLDASKYVLRTDDLTRYPDWHASDSLGLRHYVTSVRHKFWTTLCRQ